MAGRFASGLYLGAVTHLRLKPRRHALRYRMFWFLLDLDELDDLSRTLRLFSRNRRRNLFSFADADHLAGSAAPLRGQVEKFLLQAGVTPDGGPIRVLCVPRILGYAFNPLSVYLCYRTGGDLAGIVYEVNNTFGQRHCYVVPVAADQTGIVDQTCQKQFYVSPFMDMNLIYDFRVVPPAASVAVTVKARDAEGPVITTCFSGRRRELTDATLLGAFVRHPLLAMKIVAGIHWEAAQLWLKGIGVRARPPLPASTLTVGRAVRPDA